MSYENFWRQNGLNYITPKGLTDPEGFSKKEVLKELISEDQSVVEVGCGTGRLTKIFATDKYFGLDINPSAIAVASKENPRHSFAVTHIDDVLHHTRDVVLLYTVCLHIPDEMLAGQIDRFKKMAKESIVIAEIMNPKYRANRSGAAYDISNQRSPEQYIKVLQEHGFDLDKQIDMPYAYYPGENITFLKFNRRKDVKQTVGI